MVQKAKAKFGFVKMVTSDVQLFDCVVDIVS
jgi:hypothetical protein